MSLVWIEVASAVAAWVALICSLWSLSISQAAFRLAKIQDDRRKPNTVPFLHKSFVNFLNEPNGCAYAFLTSISNRSDSNNSIARIELLIFYELDENVTTLTVNTDSQFGKYFQGDGGTPLDLPANIDAGQTATGWLYFFARAQLISDIQIEKYVVRFTDSHGQHSTLSTILLQEYRDASNANASLD